MTDRILDISDRPARLTARGGLLVIDFGKPPFPSPRASAPGNKLCRPSSALRRGCWKSFPISDLQSKLTKLDWKSFPISDLQSKLADLDWKSFPISDLKCKLTELDRWLPASAPVIPIISSFRLPAFAGWRERCAPAIPIILKPRAPAFIGKPCLAKREPAYPENTSGVTRKGKE